MERAKTRLSENHRPLPPDYTSDIPYWRQSQGKGDNLAPTDPVSEKPGTISSAREPFRPSLPTPPFTGFPETYNITVLV